MVILVQGLAFARRGRSMLRPYRVFFRVLLGGFWVFLVSSAFAQATKPTITILAASSLQDAFLALQPRFERQCSCRVIFQFAGSQQLKTQLLQGLSADVFASAAPEPYNELVAAKLFGPGVVFTSNRLVVVVSAARKNQIKSLQALAQPGLKLVLGQPKVPAGAYARAFLAKASQSSLFSRDYGTKVLQNLVSEEDNVRQVLLKVQLGEADAGFVYQSDVVGKQRGQMGVLSVPDNLSPRIQYLVGGSTKAQSEAAVFMKLLQSPVGQGVLRQWGFGGR
jgi:molybdate transport system substrate-binding protein